MRFFGFRSVASLGVVGLIALGVTACSEEAVFSPDGADSAETIASMQSAPGLMPQAADASSAGGEWGPNFQISPQANGPEAGLNPLLTEQGQISLSLDAFGSTGSSGLIQVEKPAGATVRKAILFSATIPFGQTIPDGTISLGGTPVNWDDSHTFTIGGGCCTGMSYHVDVTSIVAPIVDPAPAGIINIDVVEGPSSGGIDGEILAVIFDDPNQTTDNTVVLLFGGQKTTGDQFFVSLADPIDTSDPDLALDMSLGISFGFQGTAQFSIVDVNGARLTRSAGGQDDGAAVNGALITVGGIGDSNANPPDPNAGPANNPRTDDELYSLIPFVTDGDQLILVETSNPSDDDNIFVAAFFLTLEAQVTPEPPTNEPPTAVAVVAESVECAGDATTVDLDGSGSTDPDGEIVSWQWLEGGVEIASGEITTVDLSLGSHAITLIVTDDEGLTDEVEVTVEIEDTTPPDLDFDLEHSILWPPNHKMHKVAEIEAGDMCDASPALVVTVTSNQPEDDKGDGHTKPDWRIDEDDGEFDVYVRAERDGRKDDRVYTITATATDASGNQTVTTAEVTVPHDRRGSHFDDDDDDGDDHGHHGRDDDDDDDDDDGHNGKNNKPHS